MRRPLRLPPFTVPFYFYTPPFAGAAAIPPLEEGRPCPRIHKLGRKSRALLSLASEDLPARGGDHRRRACIHRRKRP